MTPYAEIVVPMDRNGHLAAGRVYDPDGACVHSGGVYVCADQSMAAEKGNPLRLSDWPYGHLPLGLYRMNVVDPPDDDDGRMRMGHGRRVLLTGIRGPARMAMVNGRYGLMLHAGRTLYTPTYGCGRLLDVHLARWIEVMEEYKVDLLDVRECPITP